MIQMATKNPHVGRSLDEYVRERSARDEFACEFDRLGIARQVKTARKAKKLSQAQLAELAGTEATEHRAAREWKHVADARCSASSRPCAKFTITRVL